jgi:5-methylcytosine-specific restriction enzyme subunit McrC
MRLATLFQQSVPACVVDSALMKRACSQINRLNAAYESPLNLIQLLLDSQGVLLEGTSKSATLPGFLFDMNRFFQALVSRFLRDNLAEYTVLDEHRLRGMVQFDADFNPRMRRAPVLRPDFAVRRGNRIVALLDAKYRDLWENPLPSEMLYQLAMYAESHETRTATILYPAVDQTAREARLSIRSPTHAQRIAQLSLRPVVLDILEAHINSGFSVEAQRKRSRYAHWLSFGDVPDIDIIAVVPNPTSDDVI